MERITQQESLQRVYDRYQPQRPTVYYNMIKDQIVIYLGKDDYRHGFITQTCDIIELYNFNRNEYQKLGFL